MDENQDHYARWCWLKIKKPGSKADQSLILICMKWLTSIRIWRPVPGSPPRAIGVVFSDVLGFQHQASLRQVEGSEVILAAGAIGSPHLLMTSGIGDADVLGPLGIPIVVNLTGVGKDMADNPANAIYVPSPNPVEVSLIETVGITNFGSFIETASGSQASLSQVGSLGIMAPWFRSEELVVKYAEALNNLPVRTQQILGQAGVILQKVDGPSSKGNLTLNQSNIEDNPLVQFNYFSEPEDLYTCIESTRMVKQILETEAMRNYTYTTLPETILNNAELVGNLIPTRLDVDTLSEWCRNTVITIWHYHGGCGVGTVVDNEHRIIGAVGIRVIDGSTFNSSPGTNPQATVMMLGRYEITKLSDISKCYNYQKHCIICWYSIVLIISLCCIDLVSRFRYWEKITYVYTLRNWRMQ